MVQEELNMLYKNTNPNMIKQALGSGMPREIDIYNFLSNNNKINRKLAEQATRFTTNNAKFIKPLTTIGKIAKGSGILGAGLTAIDAKRSFEIADAMEKINKNRPGSFNQKDIDYYRNKGRWITGGSAIGAPVGGAIGILGGPIGISASALTGAGIGGGITGLGYEALNKYKPKKMTSADWAYLKDINNNIQNKPKQEVKKETKPQQNNNIPQQSYGPSSSIEDLIKQQQSIYGTYNTPEVVDSKPINTTNNVLDEQPLNTTESNIDIGNILDMYNNISNIRQGYLDKLQEFVDNYDTLNDKNLDREMYLRGLAGWSGNPSWSSMADKINPLAIEASKLDLYKKLAEGQIQDEKELANIVSNIRMMEQMGIDPSIAMADSKTLNNITRLMIANKQAQTRMEVANLNAKVKELDRQARIAIAQGKRDDAYKLLQMRNQANAQIAAINSIGYGGDPTAIYQAMSGFGYQVPNYTTQQDNDSNPYE